MSFLETRVLIVGLGLIGGSLALCIKKRHPNTIIVGSDINDEQCRLGKMLGIIDEVATSLEEEAIKADFIFLSTPVEVTQKLLYMLAALELKDSCIISDTGSTKETIVAAASDLKAKGISFIGGHPMAGSHKSGVAAAKDILFENAFYLLTPENHIDSEHLDRLTLILEGTKSKFLVVSPSEHDYLTGVISHFPHVVAASLVHQAEHSSRDYQLITRLAAGGFRDITRIASSSPEMWRDITLQNKHVLLNLLDRWNKEMQKVAEMVASADAEMLYDYFHKAKCFRDELPSKEKGAIPAFYDLFVDVPDYPGVVSEITGYLAKEHISITNIRILETREDINGVLVISFQTDQDRIKAEECIKYYTNYGTSTGL